MVLIVGENSVWQNTYNLSSLLPGKVNRIDSLFASAAGKGTNVARALGFLDRQALLLAFIGGPNGEKFRAACEEDGIASDFTRIGRETRTCTTLIETSGRITEIVEPAPVITSEERADFHASVLRHLAEATMLVISGTAMSGENDDCYLEFARAAHETGLPVVLDSYRNHGQRALRASPEVLKINADELSELSGRDCSRFPQRQEAACEILERYGVKWIIITRGNAGAEAFDGRRSLAAVADPVELKNAIGSGDAFTAGVVFELLGRRRGKDDLDRFPWGADIQAALRRGTAMGSANCMNLKPGHIERADYESVDASVAVSEGER